jgi:hypothetical protein
MPESHLEKVLTIILNICYYSRVPSEVQKLRRNQMTRNYRPSGYYVSRNTSIQEIEEAEEQDRIASQGEPVRLCWSVPIPGCSALRFIDVWFDEGEFCMMVNSQFSSYPVSAIKPCEVSGKPEIVARLGNVGLTAERRDALLKMVEE